ncbi:hypothetical protein, partial [Aphanizomenon flos-aquae]|uniref:hypothetical protein n=1 Tax=Aphanizomenon flos-aquae TaxID=1176 RepID=UPI001F39220D
FLKNNLAITFCKSSNPGHPDSDKIITTSSKTILPSHPVNPQILDILIQTKSSPLPQKQSCHHIL